MGSPPDILVDFVRVMVLYLWYFAEFTIKVEHTKPTALTDTAPSGIVMLDFGIFATLRAMLRLEHRLLILIQCYPP